MATWGDVKTFVHDNYKADDLSDDVMKMVFETGDLRSQLVFLTHYTLKEGTEDWTLGPFLFYFHRHGAGLAP